MEIEGACPTKNGDHMEVVMDTIDVGQKRKERNPLEEINMVGEANKKFKHEVEKVRKATRLGCSVCQPRGCIGSAVEIIPEGKRGESWRLLEHLSGRLNLPWVVMRDFNEIMFAGEKLGGNPRPKWQMNQFCEVLNRCHLRDLGYIGSDFTWSRRWGSRGWIRERLDRAFVSTSWASVFPQQRLHHVAAFTSDHCMLLLKCTQTSQRRKRKPKLFKFESMWLRDNQCDDLVVDAWE
nr:hypothetical protein CFP56_29548 [Quercus suber]